MIGTLVTLLALLLIVGVLCWAIFKLLPLMGLPEPINTVVYVIIVVIVVVILALALMQLLGGGGGGLRLGRL